MVGAAGNAHGLRAGLRNEAYSHRLRSFISARHQRDLRAMNGAAMKDRAIGEQHAPRMATTSAQYGIWMAQQMVPQSPSYSTAEAIELRGVLDPVAPSSSVVAVLNHRQSLHMRFQMDDDGRQRRRRRQLCWKYIDFSSRHQRRRTPRPSAEGGPARPCRYAAIRRATRSIVAPAAHRR